MSISFKDFGAFAAHLQRVERAIPRQIEIALKEIGARTVLRAKAKIGVYQNDYVTPQGAWFPAWEQLAPSTLEGKTALGFAPPDNPLLRTGVMQDSIGFSLSGTYHAFKVTLGSTDPKSLWQEFGTITIPPRSFIGASMAEEVQVFGLPRLREAVAIAFRGR